MRRVTAGTDEQTDAPAARAPARASRGAVVAGIAVAAVLVVATILRFTTSSDLWLDEALSVNIAGLPLGELHGALERDGAPPLYYLLLHFWMDGFGESDTAVRALSGVVSLATLPAMYYAGRRLGGRWVGWASVLLFATNPFVFRYATETRMYALVMFFVAWGYLAVVRALERPSLGRLALVTGLVAALLYTHNWSFYLVATVGLVMIWFGWRADTPEVRTAARRIIVAIVVGGVLYLPWLPTLAYQLGHTGTPWADPRLPWAGAFAFFRSFTSTGTSTGAETFALKVALLVLVLLAIFGVALDSRRIELDLRTRPLVRWQALVCAGSIGLGLVISYVAGSAFEGRYGAIGVPLLILVMAVGFMVFADDAVRVAALGIVLVLGTVVGVRNTDETRTQAGKVATVLARRAAPGDLVVLCPDQLGPAVQRALGPDSGLRVVTFPDLARPEFVNWIDYRERIAATEPLEVGGEVVARAGDATIWYVVSPGYRSVEGKCEGLEIAFEAARSDGKVRITPDPGRFYESMGLVEYRPT